MKSPFRHEEFSQEKIDEITRYIQYLVDNKTYEEVEALVKTDWKHCRYVMQFHMLPRTPLHQTFDEKFLKPERQFDAKYLEWKLIGEMKQNKEKFIKEYWIESYQFNDVKYQIIDRYFIWYWNEEDEVIEIAIPYFSSQLARDRYWYGITIYKSHCPDFFERLTKDMRVYQWNATLTSNRK